MKEEKKKILEKLASEFGEDFMSFKGKRKIRLYGANDEILNFFREKLASYLKEKGRRVPVKLGQRGDYNIDVGFFLRIGYFKGFNEQ